MMKIKMKMMIRVSGMEKKFGKMTMMTKTTMMNHLKVNRRWKKKKMKKKKIRIRYLIVVRLQEK